jgi:polysaccharide export outer membrane protein
MAAVLTLGVVLSGCALAPGTSFEKYSLPRGNPLMKWLGDEPEEPPPPPGAITRITPDLVRTLRSAPRPDPSQDLKDFFGSPAPYRIGVSDVVGVTVWGHPEFAMSGGGGAAGTGTAVGGSMVAGSGAGSGSYTVSSEGLIQFPYIGTVKAQGLTETQLRDAIVAQLRLILKNPQVTVSVQTYRSGRIFVDGEVRTPGQKFLDDVPMTLPEALSRAGGFTQQADRSAVIITRGLNSVRVNLDQLTAAGVDPNRVLLAHGDTVRVANFEDEKVYVLGEVLSAGGKPLKKGRLTLHQALGEATGVSPYSGDPRQVFVVRVADPTKPEIFHLDISSPLAFVLAEGFELRDRDVVYVDPVPLVRWNRVISLILPSAQAITVTRDTLRSN